MAAQDTNKEPVSIQKGPFPKTYPLRGGVKEESEEL